MVIEGLSISRKWTRSKKCKYDKGLIVACFIAFLLYRILAPILVAPHEELEETIFLPVTFK